MKTLDLKIMEICFNLRDEINAIIIASQRIYSTGDLVIFQLMAAIQTHEHCSLVVAKDGVRAHDHFVITREFL